jgi:hypothetical protein
MEFKQKNVGDFFFLATAPGTLTLIIGLLALSTWETKG